MQRNLLATMSKRLIYLWLCSMLSKYANHGDL